MACEMIFISGGVRSGKSADAESRILASGAARKLYIASGVASDSEMAGRITRHRQDRANDGWCTIEQPMCLSEVLPHIRAKDAVLWDCVTTWLANELYEGFERGELCADQPDCMEQKWRELQKTIGDIREQAVCFVIVSNEVLDEPLLAPVYQEWLGKIHQWLVHQADQAIEMENGIAIRRK